MRRSLAVVAVCVVLARAPRAQEDYERVELRVSAVRSAGVVVVDRGAADGLAVGDLVFFHPREGGTKGGNVAELEARSAVVELHDGSLELAPGTRGEVLVPGSRFVEPEPAEPEATEALPGQERDPAGDEVVWTDPDEEFTPDQPLLTRMRPVRPQERAMQLSGRIYVSADGTYTSLRHRSDAFLRTGADLLYENPFGRGGGLHFDGELNYRRTEVPDRGDEHFAKLRLDRLSYRDGGTRFEPARWEAGRFLQRGLPELGVLDGGEWSWRRKSGDDYGFSAGFMPEPDADFSTGRDFQIAGFYRWIVDPGKRFALGGGYQKTFHDGSADRDLVVAKLEYAPTNAWNLHATTWIDYYGSSDRVKGTSLDLTQAFVLLSRRWNDGSGMNWTYTHQSFPEIERHEFRPVEDAQLADDHDDRLALSGWRMSGENRLHGRVGGWVDEEDAGLDADLGVDFSELLVDRGRTDVTGFVAAGEFSNTWGGQISFGRALDDGRWDVFYELSFNNNVGFDDTVDDILQHRFRASRDIRELFGWSLSLNAEVRTFDDEGSASVGLYMQRSF